MITPSEARKLILEHALPGKAISVALSEAAGRCLAEDVEAPYDHPFFDQSAMDGYAFRFEDLKTHDRLRVIGEIPAGTTQFLNLGPGNAVRIFTGAAVPPTADTIVIQEHVTRNGQWMHMDPQPQKEGQHIRRRGEQIRKGEVALSAGALLDPAATGFLATLGVQQVRIYQTVSAGIIATGNEFADPSGTPEKGQIFESNTVMLRSLLSRANTNCEIVKCKDDLETISATIEKLADHNRLLFITGGVSVGDYDFTPEALEKAGFKVIFHKLNQKPGKPLLLAVKDDCVAFGLPGNPRSVLSCYYQYGLLALRALNGNKSPGLTRISYPLSQPTRNTSGKTLFHFASFDAEGIHTRRMEGSHMLASAINAPAMIELSPEQTELSEGELVTVYLLPQ